MRVTLEFEDKDLDYIKTLATMNGLSMEKFIVSCVGEFQNPDRKIKSNKKLDEQAREVLAFLNTKTGHNFKPVEANLSRIRARLKESSIEDCRAVVAHMVRKWKGTKLEEFLRPKTIFGPENFAQYQGRLTNV